MDDRSGLVQRNEPNGHDHTSGRQNLETCDLGIHQHDSRHLDEIITSEVIDVTITSPPYFDLKNYGHKDQIGFGQSYKQYLADLKIVFRKVFNVTKPSGTLWVIIDMFKKKGEVVPLPFDFVSEIKSIGWKLQEVIIWEKDRTVPWSHSGQMRNAFEYILVFSKSKKPKFWIDRVKDTDSLKKWWIRYPERYNPKGKSPTSIWNFPIPTQGSWGNGYIRHFCPLPEGLITQILEITTDESDLVLDPFAGSGAVLSRAANMNRRYVGFELNKKYISMFSDYLEKTGESKKEGYKSSRSSNVGQTEFEKQILQLRQLKFARVLLRSLKKEKKPLEVDRIFVEPLKEKTSARNKLIKCNYHLLSTKSETDSLLVIIGKVTSKPPLSKFGIEPSFTVHTELNSFIDALGEKTLWVYTLRNTHAFKKKFTLSDLAKASADEVIYSRIKLTIDERLYE